MVVANLLATVGVALLACGMPRAQSPTASSARAFAEWQSLKVTLLSTMFGGFHLFAADDEQLDWTADKLKEFQTAQILGAPARVLRAYITRGDGWGWTGTAVAWAWLGPRIVERRNSDRAPRPMIRAVAIMGATGPKGAMDDLAKRSKVFT